MAVAMRFEVVCLQEGMPLPKAVVIIPCEVRKNFHLHFWVIRMDSFMPWKLGSVTFKLFEVTDL